METLEWPAQSPGLNPIESVWREIETELGEIWGRAEDIEALKTMIENIWRDHITEEILDGLIDTGVTGNKGFKAGSLFCIKNRGSAGSASV